MSDTIRIECPGCGRQKTAKRMPHDPASAVLSVVNCPRCCGDDKETTPAYYDAGGNEVIEDPAKH